MDVFSSHCNNLAVLVERSSFNASSSNGHRSLCSFLFCSSLLRPMGGFSLLKQRAHCAFRKQIKAVQAETNAEFHLQVKNAWLTLNKERLLKLARDEALRFFQLGLLHS